MHPVVDLQLLTMLMLANGTPVIAKKMLGGQYSYPLDGNLTFADGRPVFGRSKTIRGILLSVLVTTVSAPIIGLGWKTGFLVGSFAMAGDLFSSFLQTPPRSAVEQPGERSRPDSGIASAVARVPPPVGIDGRRHCGVRCDVRYR